MRLTELAHQQLDAQVHEGDLTIDATAGNGYDTAKLAERVGQTGKVIAIDLQQAAIDSTRQRLETAKLADRSELHCGDHAAVLKQLSESYTAQASAITFNLGYLPGSDKAIQTCEQSTLPALEASAKLLQQNGLLLVTAYRGHDGGQAEADAVAKWMYSLREYNWQVESHEPIIKGDRVPPILWLARKA